MKAIETRYNNYRFRSRTEARWAVFFDHAGIEYDYEIEGFDLDGEYYLPDFWLPALRLWFEVKGEMPAHDYFLRLAKLQRFTKSQAVIAVGSPSVKGNIIRIADDGQEADDSPLYRFASDRRDPSLLWLDNGESCAALSEGGSDRWPALSESLEAAYTAARQARFEHGEA